MQECASRAGGVRGWGDDPSGSGAAETYLPGRVLRPRRVPAAPEGPQGGAAGAHHRHGAEPEARTSYGNTALSTLGVWPFLDVFEISTHSIGLYHAPQGGHIEGARPIIRNPENKK